MVYLWKAVILGRSDSLALVERFFRFFPSDERFPSDATVEFVFSSGPERIKGRLTPNQIQAGRAAEEMQPESFSQDVNTTRTTRLSSWTTTPLTWWFAGIRMRTSTSGTRTAWRVTVVPETTDDQESNVLKTWWT